MQSINLDQDYPLFLSWWDGHGFPALPQEILPSLGMLISIDGVPTAAAWCYLDSTTPLAMIEWVVTNPDAKPRTVPGAISAALEALTVTAKDLGYTTVLATCRQPSLSKVFQRQGFNVTDASMIHHITTL